MRTLVISDLHLGQGGGVSVLERPEPLAALLSALADYDRLVLLGDIVELQEVPASYSHPLADPVLRAIAEQLGADKQVVLVPGNHDHALVEPWARDRGTALQREDTVPMNATPVLSQVVASLSATKVEVRYPGVWLSDRIWATHGHYLNALLRPVSSWGFQLSRRGGPSTQAEFEALFTIKREPRLIDGLPYDRWLDKHVPSWLAPVNARLLGHQMLHDAIPAFARSARGLGVQADWIIFGHVHRRGPQEDDRPDRWRDPVSGAALLNTGSWRYEPSVVRGQGPSNRYWPGGAVSIGDDGVPRSVGLLEGLTGADLLNR